MLRNFLYRAGEYLHRNRARLIKWLLIAAAATLIIALIYYGVERWQRGKHEKRIDILEQQFRDAETKAQAAETRAAAAALAIEAKYAELRNLETRANAAEAALWKTRRAVAPLKENYDQARTAPMPTAPVSCADACAELERLTGYRCQ